MSRSQIVISAIPGERSRQSRPVIVGWILLTLAALGVGIFSLRYALPRVPFAAELPNFVVRRDWLIAHAVFASVALIVGPWQFLACVRKRALIAHRWSGRIYCGCVLAGWIASLPIATHA